MQGSAYKITKLSITKLPLISVIDFNNKNKG